MPRLQRYQVIGCKWDPEDQPGPKAHAWAEQKPLESASPKYPHKIQKTATNIWRHANPDEFWFIRGKKFQKNNLIQVWLQKNAKSALRKDNPWTKIYNSKHRRSERANGVWIFDADHDRIFTARN